MTEINNNCSTCDTCEEILAGVNSKLISIGNAALYNVRFGMGRPVDRALFRLLTFYKGALEDICRDEDCGCYTLLGIPPCSTVFYTTNQLDNTQTIANRCICGCCPPLNVTCGCQTPPTTTAPANLTTALTLENIFERVKILTA
jgi:hypothetical protein